MKKILTALLVIPTLFTMANTTIRADYEESVQPQTYEFTMSATQWEGMSETIELENGDLVEVTISNVQDVPQPRSTEELGLGTWTRYINYKYTNPNNNETFEFGWTFKVKCTLDEYPMFPVQPYNIITKNCATAHGPAITKTQATETEPARIFGNASSEDFVVFSRYVELHVTCDYHNMLRIAVSVAN